LSIEDWDYDDDDEDDDDEEIGAQPTPKVNVPSIGSTP
jgi:hypothetical protein